MMVPLTTVFHFLSLVVYYTAQITELISDRRDGRVKFIGHAFCFAENHVVRCQVERCDNYQHTRDQFLHSWTRNNQMITIQPDDDLFQFTVNTSNCTSDLTVKLGAEQTGTDVACIVTPLYAANTVSETSFIFSLGTCKLSVDNTIML